MFTVKLKDSTVFTDPQQSDPVGVNEEAWPLFSALTSLCLINRKLQTAASPPPPYFASKAVNFISFLPHALQF